MMDIGIILASARRSKIAEFAGENWRDSDSGLVQTLRERGIDAILGIENAAGLYAVIAWDALYYKNKAGDEAKISFRIALCYLEKNVWTVGKGGNFEFVELGDHGAVWFKDGATMFAMWNLLLLMGRIDSRRAGEG